MLWLSGRKSCDLSSQGFVMVPGEAEGERDTHTEGEKGKTLNNDASKSFLSNFFLFYFVSEKMADSTSLN